MVGGGGSSAYFSAAIRSAEKLYWDAANMKVTNVVAANRFVKRPVYRRGWV